MMCNSPAQLDDKPVVYSSTGISENLIYNERVTLRKFDNSSQLRLYTHGVSETQLCLQKDTINLTL